MLRVSCRFLAATGFMPHTPLETNPVVFLDVTADNASLGRVTIELFADAVPRTAENFRSLCTGERGSSRWVNRGGGAKCPLYYKGVPFHRLIPGFVAQGGDVLHFDGRGNESVFGYPFPDESFDGKAGAHLEGTVAMATSGPNQNGSQFFFNLKRSSHLDGKFVVVGQVLDGWDVVQQLSRCGSRCGTPIKKAWIAECGQSGGLGVEDLDDLPVNPAPFNLPGKEVLSMLKPRS
jgi:peptidylprolyl isomerase